MAAAGSHWGSKETGRRWPADCHTEHSVSKVFISHSSSDDKVAIEIAHAVRRSGREVFYDRWSLAPGDSLVDKIETGIADAGVLVVLLSRSSVNSPWVRQEVNAFFNRAMSDRQIRIVPILLEDVEVPPLLRDRLYIDLRVNPAAGIAKLVQQLTGLSDVCATLPDEVLIDNFDAGIMRPNFLGGSTLVYHETGDPATLNAIFPNRGRGRALGLAFNFRPSGRGIPPHFVGYATRLPLSDWTEFVHCRYWLCFDVWSDGNAPSIQLEIKRLKTPPIEQSRQEIAKWQINLPQSPVWRSQSLRLADIQFPQASWDNLWEICLVLFRDRVAGDEGLVQVDDLRLARGPN